MGQAFDELVKAFPDGWQIDPKVFPVHNAALDKNEAVSGLNDSHPPMPNVSDNVSEVGNASVSDLQAKIEELTASLRIRDAEILDLLARNRDLRVDPADRGPPRNEQRGHCSASPSPRLCDPISSSKLVQQESTSPVQDAVAELLQMPSFLEGPDNSHSSLPQNGMKGVNGWEAHDPYNGRLDSSLPPQSSHLPSHHSDATRLILPSPTQVLPDDTRQQPYMSSSSSNQSSSSQALPGISIRIAGISGRKAVAAKKHVQTPFKIAGSAKRAAPQVSKMTSRRSTSGSDTTIRRPSSTASAVDAASHRSDSEDDGWKAPRLHQPKGWRLPNFHFRQPSSDDENNSSPEKLKSQVVGQNTSADRKVLTAAKVEAESYHPAWKSANKSDEWRPRPYAKDSESRAFPNGRGADISRSGREGESARPRRSTHFIGEQATQDIDYEEYRKQMDQMEADVDPWRASWENQRQGIAGRFNNRNRNKPDIV